MILRANGQKKVLPLVDARYLGPLFLQEAFHVVFNTILMSFHFSYWSVAMSCTLNLQVPKLEEYFDLKFLVDAKKKFDWKGSEHPATECQSKILTALEIDGIHGARRRLSGLKLDHHGQRQYINVLNAVDKMSVRYMTLLQSLTLRYIDQLYLSLSFSCSLAERHSYGKTPSEADHVHGWKDVFNDLLNGTEIYMRR
jgi:hypothetical protein